MENKHPMIDQNNPESFEMSESDREGRIQDGGYYDDPSYRGWEKKTFGSTAGQYIRHNGILFVSIGVGLAVLFILFRLLPTTQIGTDKKQIMALEGRIAQLEERMDQLSSSPALKSGTEGLTGMGGKVEDLKSRVEQIEASVLSRVDDIAAKLKNSDNNKSHEDEKPAEAPKQAETPKQARAAVKPAEAEKRTTTAAPAPQTEPQAKAPKRYHEVQPKETLFSISQKYDLTVDELRRLNHMSPTDMLKYGQRLVVTK